MGKHREKINGHEVIYYSSATDAKDERCWYAFIHTKDGKRCMFVHGADSFDGIVKLVHDYIHRYEVARIVEKTS